MLQRRDGAHYELTDWGYELRDTVYALGRWAGPLMARPRGDDHFQMPWLQHMVIARFEGYDPDRAELTVELCIDNEVFTLESRDGCVELTSGRARQPDVILTGPTVPVVGYLLGRITVDAARKQVVLVRAGSQLGGLRPRGERLSAEPT